MNRPCEGSAKSGAAFFYAQILFHFCAHPANGFFCWGKDGKCLRSEMRRLNAPDRQVTQEVKEE